MAEMTLRQKRDISFYFYGQIVLPIIKPDIFNVNIISSAEIIALQQKLYDSGYYAPNVYSTPPYAPVPPVVWLLQAVKQGKMTMDAAMSRMNALKKSDVRNDVQRYLYRSNPERQYTLQVSGQMKKLNYAASAGLYESSGYLVGTDNRRITGRARANYSINTGTQLSASLSYTDIRNRSGNNPGYNYISSHGGKKLLPYTSLAGDDGKALPFYGDYNPDYIKYLDSLGFLDNTYYPLKDIGEENNTVHTRDHVLNLGISQVLTRHLQMDIKYQFERQSTVNRDFHSGSSYWVRDLINNFTAMDKTTGELSRPVPWGGVADLKTRVFKSSQGRVQLSYNNNWSNIHSLSLIGGGEIREYITTFNSTREYGIGNPGGPFTFSDSIQYTPFMPGEAKSIPVLIDKDKKTDYLLSTYTSATYSYRSRYIAAISSRQEAANLFGANTNGKWHPIWSIGLAWHVDKEDFFKKIEWLSSLTARGSAGTTGNISRLTTGYTTIVNEPGSVTGTPFPSAYIDLPANKDLRWETVRMLNFGVDFATRNHILTGTIEYYSKDPRDLMAKTFIDPTYGTSQDPNTRAYYYANSGAMHIKGLDAELISRNLTGKLQWSTDFILSYVSSRVTRFSPPNGPGKSYLGSNSPNPVSDRPLFAVYAFKWFGLDPNTGDPRSSYQGQASTKWVPIYDSTSLENMVYKGPAQPPVFGSLRNTFGLGAFNLSFTISYKLGYYFRKPALNYYGLLTQWNGLGSYEQRWQRPGDELHTNVPSLKPGAPEERDLIYAYSTAMVDRADNIRLEDINLSFNRNGLHVGNIHLEHLKVFAYLSNICLLWAANKDHLDPYYVNIPKEGVRISFGCSITY